MTTNEEIKEFAKSISPEPLPRDETYQVMAARPTKQSEPVTEPIEGYYHALYMLNQIEEEKGYIGVSFHLEEV